MITKPIIILGSAMFFLLLVVNYLYASNSDKKIAPPIAKKIKKLLTAHNHTRTDNYYWLNQREDHEVVDYLKAENQYTKAMLHHSEKFQHKLYQEIISRIKQTDESVPYRLRGYYYYTRYEKGKEYPIYCRKKESLEGPEQVLLDVNALAQGHKFCQVVGMDVSPNDDLLAFGLDTVGRRQYTIHFQNLISGKSLPDRIANTSGSVAWGNDNRTVFYAVKDKALRPYKIYRHVLGSKKANQEVYHEKDSAFYAFTYKSKSEKYIMIGSESTVSSEYRFLDADTPDGQFQVIQPRERNLEYGVAHFQDHFYIRTNYHAKNFKLVKAPVATPQKKNWVDVLPHRPEVLLEDIEIFKRHLVVEERHNGLIRLRIIRWNDNVEHYIDLEEATYTAYIGTNPEFNSQILRYGYSSLTTPSSIYDYDMDGKTKQLRKRQEVLGDFKPERYHAERLYATAKDGVKIPISLVYRKDLRKKTGNPLYLYAYGSYGYSMDAYFSSVRLSLLDRGFIYAIAHIRGGQEMGRDWYENGKLLHKKNTFTDYIACAEHLIANKYSTADMLFTSGGSAGGLLVGAVVNMRPDLFKGAVANVPFVDVVTTMLDESIPLTTGEFDEWGNPKNKKFYDYMLSYSPYDNVTAQNYPAMLVLAGLHDSQVQYWEPAKWVAKLRATKTDTNLLLLHTEMSAGHSGASGRFQRYKETAMEYTFIFNLLGIGK